MATEDQRFHTSSVQTLAASLVSCMLAVVVGSSGVSDITAVESTAPAVELTDTNATADDTTIDNTTTASAAGEPRQRTLRIVETYKHDSTYTQGLEFIDEGTYEGMLLESGGQWQESKIRVWDPVNNSVLIERQVDDGLFAEGATIVGDDVWQLTWQSGRALRYDLETLEPQNTKAYDGEGWGLCLLGDRLVMSDGSANLEFRDVVDFASEGTVEVKLSGVAVSDINELECVIDHNGDERVWANIYQSNTIIGIDPASGAVVDEVDASALVPSDFVGDTDRVLNGIAYNPDTGHFWLTGKRWPVLYEVDIQ